MNYGDPGLDQRNRWSTAPACHAAICQLDKRASGRLKRGRDRACDLGVAFMMQAIDSESAYIEGLRDRILAGNKRPPPYAPGPNVQPRLPNQPGKETPKPAGKIPASSQRPGKRVNETIPYGRLCFTNFEGSAADPQDMLPGDIMLVHRTKDCIGHDTNRASKAATWRQLNAVFASGRLGGTALGVGAGMLSLPRLVTHRLNMAEELLQRLETDAFNAFGNDYAIIRLQDPLNERDGAPLAPNPTRKQLLERRLNALTTETFDAFATAAVVQRVGEGRLTRGRLVPFYEDARVLDRLLQLAEENLILPEFDWRALPILADWTPDGVLMSRDDDEHNADWFRGDQVNLGVMLNIAVQGYAAVRNALRAKISNDPREFEQLIDPASRVRDTLLLLLVCNTSVDPDNNSKSFTFYYKPTTMRIVEDQVHYGRTQTQRPDFNRAHPVEGCLTLRELRNTVAAWKIGTVMDNRLVAQPEPKIGIHVAIEEIPLTMLSLQIDGDPEFLPKPPKPALKNIIGEDVPRDQSLSLDGS